MLPGWDGAIDGYAQKYLKLGEHIRSHEIGAVVRSGNPDLIGFPFEVASRSRLIGMLAGIGRDSLAICDHPSPEIYLLGFSAGASVMAATAPHFPQITRMLLIAPSADAGYDALARGLGKYSGEVYIVVGADDEVVGNLPQQLFELATQARKRELRVIPNCDHQFRGAINGRILSQAPLWAFKGDISFPDPQRGIHLYN